MGCELCKPPRDNESEEVLKNSPRSTPDPGTLMFLSKVPLFKRLPGEQHEVLASACQKVSFNKGAVLMTQGEDGHEFFVIVSGQVAVSIDNQQVAVLSSGDFVGEMALLRNEPRTATITAVMPVSALKITRDKFRELGLNDRLEFAKRQAVGGGGDRVPVTKPPSAKKPDERTFIVEALKRNSNLTAMLSLDTKKCTQLADLMWEEQIPAGKAIIEQGDTDADYFYIVKEGSFEILLTKNPDAQSAESAVGNQAERLGTVAKGGSFGELALLYFQPRASTVKAKVSAVVYVIDRLNFKTILTKSAEEFTAEYKKYLDKMEILAALKDDEKKEVAKALMEMNFNKGETIFEQGEKGTTFFILYDGEVAVIKDNQEVAKLKGTPAKAVFFGELAIMSGEARAATIKVVSDVAKTLSMDKESFDMLLGPLEDIKKRGKDGGQSQVGKGRSSTMHPPAAHASRTKIHRKDLHRLGLLGCGGFGAVELVEHIHTKETYALKALSKGYIVKCGMKKGVISEKNIQMMCDSPFIVKLYETYNGEQTLYFLLELALGGELYATYSKKGFHGSSPHAKFYIAGTVFAFEHLHERKIVFRDLKPENLLLTETGHLKLTDMGLAKVVLGKTYTTCGTPDYFAPELIASSGHTIAVDWWTLGILTFELMAGHPPFESAAPMQIYSKVTRGINKITFPPKLRGSCEDLVKNLCKKEPTDRLPMRKGGTENIKKHAWFGGFDWAAMKACTMDPPYKPKVKSKKDIQNFSARKEDMPPQVKYKDDGSGWDKDFATSS